jgi:hypothetical protein
MTEPLIPLKTCGTCVFWERDNTPPVGVCHLPDYHFQDRHMAEDEICCSWYWPAPQPTASPTPQESHK